MSSRKNVLLPFHTIVNGDMSQSSVTSAVTEIQYLDNISIQLQWTGSPVGTFQIQTSLDYNQDYLGNVTNTGTWVTLPQTTISTSVGSPISYDLNQLAEPYIRILYTKVSGSGTLQGYISGKML